MSVYLKKYGQTSEVELRGLWEVGWTGERNWWSGLGLEIDWEGIEERRERMGVWGLLGVGDSPEIG